MSSQPDNLPGEDPGVDQGRNFVELSNNISLACKDEMVARYCVAFFEKRFVRMRHALPNSRNPAQVDLHALRCEYQRLLQREAARQEWYDFEVVDGQRQVLRNEDGSPKLIPIEVSVR